MLKRLGKWRFISFLLSFALLVEAAVPLGAVSAYAAQDKEAAEQTETVPEPSGTEDTAADPLYAFSGQDKIEEELSEDEYDERGPLSAFDDEDEEDDEEPAEEEEAGDEEGVKDEALEAKTSGTILLKYSDTHIVELPGQSLYFAIFHMGYACPEFILKDDLKVEQELPINGRKVTIHLNGHTLTGGSNRLIKVGSNAQVTIDGYGPDSPNKKGVIQDFYSKNNGGAFYLEKQSELILKNVNVIRCKANNGGVVDMLKQSSLKLYNTVFDGNNATKRAGAIYIDGPKCNVSMDSESQLRWNGAGTHGGAIYVNDARAGIYGGASGTLIEHNTAQKDGGGIYVDGANDARNAGDAVIRNLRFDQNVAWGDGGAVYINCGGCSFTGIKATGNKAGNLGGAICDIGSSKPLDRTNSFADLELTGNSLTKNKSYGGGLYAASTQNVSLSGKVIVQNNKDNNNSTDNIYLWDNWTEHAFLVLGSIAAQSKIGIMRNNQSYGQITKTPAFVDIRCFISDRSNYHMELDNNPGSSTYQYLLIKAGAPAAQPKPTVAVLDLSKWKTGRGDTNRVYQVNGQTYPVYYGYASSPSHTDEEKDLLNKYFYSDGYFLNNPDKYDIHLATMGMNVAMASADSNIKGHSDYRFKFDNIKSLLQGIGCQEENIYINDWYIEKPTDDSIGVAIAKKTIYDKSKDETYTLVPIAIRSYGYEKEWASNMTLNGKNTKGEANAEASGFRSARTHVMDALEYYMDHYGLRDELAKGRVIFWLNGFSRGSATANLTGKYLVDKYGVYSDKYKKNPNKVFAYCYAVPAGGTDSAEPQAAKDDNRKGYYCIHNIINKVDLTPMVAPEMMGFKRYGVDHYVPGDAEAGTVKTDVKTASTENGSVPYTLMYDNTSWWTNETNYQNVRQSMLDQLLGINEEVNFSDYFKVADFGATRTPKFKPASKGLDKNWTIEQWLPDMYSKVQTWDTLGNNVKLTRSNYSEHEMKEGKDDGKWSRGITAQDAFRGLVMLMLSKTPSEKAALSTALGSVTNKLAAPFSTESGPSILTILNKLIKGNDWQDKNKQQWWLDFFWGKLTDNSHGQPSIKDKSVMSDAELKAFESYFPALMGLAFRIMPQDMKANDFHLVSSFAYNTETILQGHVPEIYLAWLRQYDDYYKDEAKKSYEWNYGGAKPSAPESELEPGQTYNGTQTLKLKSNEGSSIYYTIDKSRDGVTEMSPLKLYRSGEGITLAGDRSGKDVKYTVKTYAIRDEVSNGKRTWTASAEKTYEYTIGKKYAFNYRTRRTDTTLKTVYYSAGEKVKVTVEYPGVQHFFDGWNVTGVELTPEQQKKWVLEFTMPGNDVTAVPIFSEGIVKITGVELSKQPARKGKTTQKGNIKSLELELAGGEKLTYVVPEDQTNNWYVYPADTDKLPERGLLKLKYATESKYFSGDEWLYSTLPYSVNIGGKTYRISGEVSSRRTEDICAECRNDNVAFVYHVKEYGKPQVTAISVPQGRIYPYCGDQETLKGYLDKEAATLTLTDESTVREPVKWDASSYTPAEKGGQYTFTGTLKNDVNYDDLSGVSSPVSIAVNVEAATKSPVPSVNLNSGEYINEEGRDSDAFQNDDLIVTATVRDMDGKAGEIYYKAEEYTDTEPTEAPEVSSMTKCESDGRILLQGTKNATRKYKLWLAGYNENADINWSTVVAYTYVVTVPDYQNVTVEVYDVNDPSKPLYTSEPESNKVGDGLYLDEELVMDDVEALEGYTGVYWTDGITSGKIRDAEYYLDSMPAKPLTVKLYVAKTVEKLTVYAAGYLEPETGYDLDPSVSENRISIGGTEYTLSGNQVKLAYDPADRSAMGGMAYTVSGNLSFAGMKGSPVSGNTVTDLSGRYYVAEDLTAELVESGAGSETYKVMCDAEADEDGLTSAISFSHTFDPTGDPVITDVIDPEDVEISWAAGDRSYDSLVKPKLPGNVHVITNDGSLSSLPVEWDHEEAKKEYRESSVRSQDLYIKGTVKVPEGYKAYDLYEDEEEDEDEEENEEAEVKEFETEVYVSLEGAPAVIMPRSDPDGASIQCEEIFELKDTGEKDEDGNPVTEPVSTGRVEGSMDVVLSCETEGAEIYYTLDGTDPLDEDGNKTDSAQKYATTSGNYITIAGTPGDEEKILKVAATKAGMQPSETYTTVFEFLKPEAEVPEDELEALYDTYLEPGQKLSEIELPEGWSWKSEYMDDDPKNLPAEGEDEVGDIVYAALAYNPDPSKFEDADIELDVPILAKEYYIDGRCQAYLKLSANEVAGDEDVYTPYTDGYYLSERVYTAPEGADVVVFYSKAEDKKEFSGWLKQTASGKDITFTKDKIDWAAEVYCSELQMPGEDILLMPLYEEKSACKVEGLTVDKKSVSMNIYDTASINVTVKYSAEGSGDKPKPEVVDLSGLVSANMIPGNTDGSYRCEITGEKPGEGTVWIYCGEFAEPVAVKINELKEDKPLFLVSVVNGTVIEADGKAVSGDKDSYYATKGSKVTVKAKPSDNDLKIFDRWTLKGVNTEDDSDGTSVSANDLEKEEITFTVTRSTKAEANYKDDPAYTEDQKQKEEDKNVKVKKLTLLGSDGSKSIVFDVSDPGAVQQKELTATATYNAGAEPEIVFTSSNKNVVVVKRDESKTTGTVKAKIVAKGSGEAYITAYCGNKTAKINVSVSYKSNASGIFIDGEQADSLELNVGSQQVLNAEVLPYESTDQITGITWKVSDKKVLTVNKGLVTAKKAGTATVQAIIKVKPAGAKKAITLPAAECNVTVKAGENDMPKNQQNDKNYKLTLSKSSLKIDRTKAAEQEIKVKIGSPKKPLTLDQVVSGNEISAESSNTDVVIVDDPGLPVPDSKGKSAEAALKVTAMGPGTAYIIVKSKRGSDGFNQRICKVTVTTSVKSLEIVSDSQELPGEVDFPGVSESGTDAEVIRIKQGSYDRLYYEVDPSDTTDVGKISWSANGGVTVKNGVIYAKSISKTDKKTGKIKPAEVTLKCGKIKHTIKVIVQ